MDLPRLRWVLSGEKWPDWLWLLIGVGCVLAGLGLLAYGAAMLLGYIKVPSHHSVSHVILVILYGPGLVCLGIVEGSDAIGRIVSRSR